jgi:PPOX class probable FMN-dependent enzyme
MSFTHRIEDLESLRALYGQTTETTVSKIIDRVDEGARSFIAASPFLVIASTSASGSDASPRGGPPGFVQVLDERRLAFGDLSGNRILDTYRNIVEHPHVGLIFVIPGMDETLRVNGRACLTTDPEVLERCRIEGRLPKVAVGIEVEQCYVHCAKAFRRSNLWKPATWPSAEERPSAACLLVDHLGIDIEPEVLDAALEESYAVAMWEPGAE